MNGNKKSDKNPTLKKRAQPLPEPELPEEEENFPEEDQLNEDDLSLDDIEEEEQPEFDENDDFEGQDDEYPEEEDAEEGEEGQLDLERNIMEADLGLLNMKIQEILQKLSVMKGQGSHATSRISLLVELRKLFCKTFNYNSELMEYIMELLSPAECFAFLEMMDTARPVTIRVNSLRTQRAALVKALTEKTVNLEPIDEISKMAFKINSSKVPIGATTEYLSGHYMLQSAASMLAVRALAPQPDEKVLDLSAAPGGKTTYIGQLMKNKGIIVANDLKKERIKALHYNCQRMGLTNVIITNYDGRKFPSCLKNFDRVLLDAPCTGLGVISRDPSIKAKRTVMDIYKAAHLQRELLRKAVDLCKVGGYVVYSTCSFAVEENEMVVDYICKKRYVKIVDTGLEIESKAFTGYKDNHFNDRIKYCVRVMPHIHNLDGFFVAKLLKVKDGERKKEVDVPRKSKGKKHNKFAAPVVEEEAEVPELVPIVGKKKVKQVSNGGNDSEGNTDNSQPLKKKKKVVKSVEVEEPKVVKKKAKVAQDVVEVAAPETGKVKGKVVKKQKIN